MGQNQGENHPGDPELKEGRNKLSESEEHFRLITDNMEDEIWLMDMDMNVTYLTPSVQRYRGFSLEDMKKMDWTEHLTPESLEVAIKALELALTPENLSQKDREVTGTQDLEFYCKDGSTVWSETTIKLLRDENREPVGLLGVAHDITERKQAEEALRESEAQLEESNQLLSGVLEHTHMMAVFLDTQFNFIWVNRTYADTCKQVPSFFPGKNHFDLYPHEENQAIFQRVVDTAEPFFVAAKAFEFPDQPERGMTYWDWSLIPAKDGTGKVTGLVFTLAEVTERIRAEEALRESENRLNIIFESAPDAYYVNDFEGTFIDGNKAAEELLGYSKEELIGKNFADAGILPMDQVERAFNLLAKNINGEATGPDEFTLERKDGTKVDVEILTHPVKIGGEDRTLGIARDITERKRVDELQRVLLDIDNSINTCKSLDELYPIIHRNLSQILETTNFFIALYNKNCHTLSFPYYADEQDEYEVVSAEKTNCHYIIRTGEALLADREVFADLNARGEIVTREELSRPLIWLGAPLKRGDEVFGVLAVQSYTDPKAYDENDKEILQLVSFQIANAIDEVKAEEALRESEEKYRTLFEDSRDTVYITDKEGILTNINNSGCYLFGYTMEEIIGLDTAVTYVDPEEQALFLELINEMDSVPHFEVKLRKKDGTEVDCLITASARRDEDDRILGYQGIIHDITGWRMAENRVYKEFKRAEFYNDLMSHDINNFNQGVMSNLELLLMSAELSENGRKYAKGALGQVTGSANLISNLRKLSDLRLKGMERRNIEITPVIQEAVDHVNTLFPDRSLKIRSAIMENRYIVKGNELLFDVFSNLLNNAVKFDRHEEVIVDVQIGLADDGFWKLEFKDRGHGIGDESKKMIFDRLKREDDTIQGSGLGLTLVKTIIDDLGGEVWVEDRVKDDRSKGSNFVLLLPKGD